MKSTTKILITICLITIFLAGKIKSNNKNTNSQKPPTPKIPENYKLMIVGDQGEFQYFKGTYDDANRSSKETKKEKIELIFDRVSYDVKDRKCIETNPSDIYDLTDLSINKEMINFDDLISTKNFQKKIDYADGIVFLGGYYLPRK